MITSITNGRIKQLVALRERGRLRNKEGVFVAEGLKMFEEAPMEYLKEVYVKETLWQQLMQTASKQVEGRNRRIGNKLQQCMEHQILVEQLTEEVFNKAADTQTPQGILFVMKQFSWSLPAILENARSREQAGGRAPLFLVLEDIQDPGNLGTMLRTAEGAGVDGVIVSKGTVDVYNPKTIRSTMGSLYRIPLIYSEDLTTEIALLKKANITVYAAHLKGSVFFDEIAYQGGSAFLIGNESNGLSNQITAQADCLVKIPMEGSLESLNAAVAAALLAYQAAGCQRKATKHV